MPFAPTPQGFPPNIRLSNYPPQTGQTAQYGLPGFINRDKAIKTSLKTDDAKGFFYNSYSGADYRIHFLFNKIDKKPGVPTGPDIVQVDTLQTVSISSARSVYPVRVIGRNSPIDWTGGARTLAGSLIFTVAAKDVFAGIMSYGSGEKVYGNDEPFFVDQLPLFSILIYASNERGHSASAAIVGVKMTNFGTVFSTDDQYQESSYSFTAKYYFPFVADDPIRFLASLEKAKTSTHNSVGPTMLDPTKLLEDMKQEDHKKQFFNELTKQWIGPDTK